MVQVTCIIYHIKNILQRSEPRWVRQNAKKFCNIQIIERENMQVVTGIEEFDRNMYYVYVDVKVWLGNKKADYYILSDKKAKEIFGEKYSSLYHKVVGARQNINSTDFWVEYNDVKSFKDRWPKIN